MSPPAGVVFFSSSENRCSCQSRNARQSATVAAPIQDCGETRRRRDMGAHMFAPSEARGAVAGPAMVLADDLGETEDTVEADALALAVPPAGVALRAGVQ